jgi:hypothetical protein
MQASRLSEASDGWLGENLQREACHSGVELLGVYGNEAGFAREALPAHGSIDTATLDDTFKHESKIGKH